MKKHEKNDDAEHAHFQDPPSVLEYMGQLMNNDFTEVTKMKAEKSLGIISFIMLLVMVSSSYAQMPKPGSGRDAANFIPMRERVKIMENFWA